jgi:hypothetical protein
MDFLILDGTDLSLVDGRGTTSEGLLKIIT